MNFKSTSLFILGLTLLAQSPELLAAKKSSLEEIKDLEASLLKNKNSIDNLLNTRAHIIPKEIDSLISGPGAGDYTRKGPLYSAIRQVSLDAIKKNAREDLFTGQDAMAKLLKNYQMSSGDRAVESSNPSEKVYSLTVLNQQNLPVLQKANAALKTALNEEDNVVKTLATYIQLSMNAKRFISYKEAEALSNQIAKMNSDLNTVEELAVKLSARDQAAVETFKKNMNEFLNKKLVFVEINKKGFKTDVVSDYYAFATGITNIGEAKLNRDYTPAHIAKALKAAFVQMVVSRHLNSNWDDFAIQVRRTNPTTGLFGSDRDSYRVSYKDADKINFEVSADSKTLTISGDKFKFSTAMGYSQTASFIMSQDGKQIYDHISQYKDDGYSSNIEGVRTLLSLVKGEEISMKNIYKDFGLDSFATELGNNELSAK